MANTSYKRGIEISNTHIFTSEHERAPRGVCAGHTNGSRIRLERKIWSVNANTLSGVGVAVTLTVGGGEKSIPDTAKEWTELMPRLLKRIDRLYGIKRSLWVTEYQRRSHPHYHLALYLERADMTLPWAIIDAWLDVASKYNPGALGQHVAAIRGGAEGWLGYLKEHHARGVKHVQRDPNNAPDKWKENKLGLGRCWAFSRTGWVFEEVIRTDFVGLNAVEYIDGKWVGSPGDKEHFQCRRRVWNLMRSRCLGWSRVLVLYGKGNLLPVAREKPLGSQQKGKRKRNEFGKLIPQVRGWTTRTREKWLGGYLYWRRAPKYKKKFSGYEMGLCTASRKLSARGDVLLPQSEIERGFKCVFDKDTGEMVQRDYKLRSFQNHFVIPVTRRTERQQKIALLRDKICAVKLSNKQEVLVQESKRKGLSFELVSCELETAGWRSLELDCRAIKGQTTMAGIPPPEKPINADVVGVCSCGSTRCQCATFTPINSAGGCS